MERQLAQTHGREFRRCLLDLDVRGLRKLWSVVSPQSECHSDEEVLYSMHLARTAAASIPQGHREYSRRWLEERGLGSLMPNELKPKRLQLPPFDPKRDRVLPPPVQLKIHPHLGRLEPWRETRENPTPSESRGGE